MFRCQMVPTKFWPKMMSLLKGSSSSIVGFSVKRARAKVKTLGHLPLRFLLSMTHIFGEISNFSFFSTTFSKIVVLTICY